MRYSHHLSLRSFSLCAALLGFQSAAMAADKLNPDEKTDSQVVNEMRSLAKLPVPPAHKDFSMFRLKPEGDRVVEQSDRNRLMFWTKDGRPDGYAQRRGGAIIYYDASGNAVKVQRLTPQEMGQH